MDVLQSTGYARAIRALSLRLVHTARASHIGSALSISDLIAVLYSDIRLLRMDSHVDPGRDRLFLSKGHACVALYSALCLKGFFSEEDLMSYGSDYSPFMNHASHHVPGVEFSTGALGHALSVACGLALSAKLRKDPWHTFVVMSDGELQEGSNWEALMFAAHHQLSNITICVDCNNLQSLTSVDATLSLNPLSEKFVAFGWRAETIDGHSHPELSSSLRSARNDGQPTALLLRTTKGHGVSFMENSVAWHYKSPNAAELEQALNEIHNQ